MAESRLQPWRTTVLGVLGASVICSLLPLWEVWQYGSWEASCERGSFWWMLWEVYGPASVSGGLPWSGGYGGYSSGAAITAVSVTALGTLGFLLDRLRRGRVVPRQSV